MLISLNKGRIDTKALSEISGYHDLADIDSRSTRVINYTETEPEKELGKVTLKFNFNVRLEYNLFQRIIIGDLIFQVFVKLVIGLFCYIMFKNKYKTKMEPPIQFHQPHCKPRLKGLQSVPLQTPASSSIASPVNIKIYSHETVYGEPNPCMSGSRRGVSDVS